MSAIENAIVSDSTPVKKSFPAKYLKYLSYGLHIIKQMYPDDYKQKAIQHLNLYDSIESIMEEIDTLDATLENEVKEIKRDALKKTKSPRKSRTKGKKASDETITEQIVELANEPTIVRGPADAEETVDVPAETKVAKKPRAPKKKAKVDEPKGEVIVDEPKGEVIVDEPKDEVIVDEPKGEVTVDEPKGEVIVDEPKEEVAAKKPRAAPKKKAKVDVKDEVKDEVKEDVKEDVKDEVKDDAKVSKKRVAKPKAKKSESVISEESTEPMTPELTEDPEQ